MDIRKIKEKVENDFISDSRYNKGITLVVLVVTIIVLLILAGVSIGLVFNSEGLFQKASVGASKYNKKQAEEVLITKLQEAQMEKYSQGLTYDRLNKMINEIGKVNESDNSLVTVGKYVFEIDRTVPKVVRFKEEADKPENGSSSSEENTENDKLTNNIMVTLPLEDMTLRFGAIEVFNELNIKEFNYSITPTDGIPIDKSTGTFKKDETVEITATKMETYTIKVTAKDSTGDTVGIANVKMTTKYELPAVGEEPPAKGWTIAEAKGLVARDGLKAHLGEKVQYSPEQDTEGVYRIFYYDNEVNSEDSSKGYFGTINTLYLKRDWNKDLSDKKFNTTLRGTFTETEEGTRMMKLMHPKWTNSSNSNAVDTDGEKAVNWICDTTNWEKYKTQEASFVIGSPSIEMYMKAFNVWKQNDPNGNALICKIGNANGYFVGANGVYAAGGSYTADNSIENGPEKIFGPYMWIASPQSGFNYAIMYIAPYRVNNYVDAAFGLCPIVAIN